MQKARSWGGIATLAAIVTLSTLSHNAYAYANGTVPPAQIFLPLVSAPSSSVVAATVSFVSTTGVPLPGHDFAITTRCPGYILSSTFAADAAGNWAGDIEMPVGCWVTLEDANGNSVEVIVGQGEYTVVVQ